MCSSDLDIRMIHDFEKLRLDQKHIGDTFRFNRRERLRGVVAALQHDRAAADKGPVDQHLGKIRERAIDELTPPPGILLTYHIGIGRK